ncbi:MAG: metallophosphoesterase [Eubacteriales bacterium]|nr:metallophosphoesterase [Eubacteriales bacterium]
MAVIFHAADLHIGARFDFLPTDLARKAIVRQLAALRDFLADAAEHHADAVLLAGDLFDTPEVPAPLASAVFSLLEACTAPVFLSPGNHDYYFPRSPYAHPLPSNVTVFTERTLTPVALPDGQTVIWGAAFQDTKASIPLHAPLDPHRINLGLVHGEIGSDGGYNPIREEDVRNSGFDYLALGHNHRFPGVFRWGDTTVSCPGCLTPTSTAETGKKGYLAGTVSKHAAAMDFFPSTAIRMEEISLPMDRILSDRMLAEQLLPHMPEDPASVCCTIQLTGSRSFAPNLAALEQSLRPVFFHVRLRDHAVALDDLYRYERDDSLCGYVTRDLKQQIDHAATEEQHAKLTLALEFALAALEGRTLVEGGDS